MKPWWNNIINDKMTIQFMHRLFGTILLLSTFYLKFKSYQINVTSQHRYSINLLVICTTIQYMLGIMTLLLYIPIGLGVLHQIGAIITTLLCLLTIFNLKYS